MRILVTNDDGIESPGIWALADAMSRVGEVVVVAPDRQQSGVGTAVSFHHGLTMEETTSSMPGVRAYAVNGTPTDCVILGLGRLADSGIDLIVSGINTGANIGSGLLGSGTVMPTRVASARGICSFAVSLSRHGPHDRREMHFHLAGRIAELLALAVKNGELPQTVTLNVNAPSVPDGETRGVAVTSVAPIGYWRLRTEQPSDGFSYHRLSPIDEGDPRIEEGTDIWAINRGLVSITPLRFEVTDYEIIPALIECINPIGSTLKMVTPDTDD
jgi:5'-nucleotidase